MNFKKISVGRASDNDIIINHPSVSRYHMELFYDSEGNTFLTDLNSANGTFVNGQRIFGSIQLKSNDIVKAGLSEPLRWKNYNVAISDESSKVGQQNYENVAQNYSDNTEPPKKRKIWRTIGITLLCIVLLAGIFYLANEYVFIHSKPAEVDPEKPNDKSDQPQNVQRDKRKSIEYDFSCLNDEKDFGTTEVIGALEKIESEMTDAIGGEITLEEEVEVGNQLLNDCRATYNFIEKGKQLDNLKSILNLLTSQILEPKGFNYSIYLIDSKELNAFTAGAKIFITTTMYKFCLSNDELACVIGHEINHNELGHIKEYLQKVKILTEEGAAINQFMTIPFGQKKETHCDLMGIDLVIAAGYNGCVNIALWERMKKAADEGEYNAIENLMRSHPYSDKRANCSHNHILNNYGFECYKTNN